MNYFITLNATESKEIIPGFFGRFVHTENISIVFWEAKGGSTFPEHAHPHEQIATIQEGKFQLTINGETKILEEGVVAIIPSNAKHSGIALTDCKLMDVFYPVREDYKQREKIKLTS
jgi:quercetin dioxygenase-like cupin family protein